MSDFSYVFNAHPSFIDQMYAKYQSDPSSIEDGWRVFFEGFEFGGNGNGASTTSTNGSAPAVSGDLAKEFAVMSIIHGFRDRGHLLSKTNPIRQRKDRKPHLNLADYGLTDADLLKKFNAGNEIGLSNATLGEIIERLQKIYAGNTGFEYAHIENREKRIWLRDKIEKRQLDGTNLSIEKKRRILEKLNGAVGFEDFLHTKYVGQKRFSLEGGESTIPALDAIITKGGEMGVKEVIIGMAHRGRLNVLANIMGKTYEHIFNEFEGTAVPDLSFGDGDVKYHLGYSSQVTTPAGNEVYLKLVPNPSHLESVNPVVEGFSRAKADILYGSDYDQILPILIHGDAAVAGQGVSYETVQMSQLDGYYTGGTIHFVINNQIGFTTDYEDARSSTYCTAAASLVQAPVFHINGDDPEAVIFAVELATEYRQKFNNDVFIDMVCYRKHGHNEGDDPKFTQPQMYDIINKHSNPRELYSKLLIERGDVEADLAKEMEVEFKANLQERLDEVKEKPLPYQYQEPEQAWRALKKKTTAEDFDQSPNTGIKAATVKKINEALLQVPTEIKTISKVNRLMKGKKKLWDAKKIDWAMAELTAYSSILMEGNDVRISGQDVRRGTFSHRHAIFRDAETGEYFNRLNHFDKKQGKFRIFNSFLSEFAVMGFEYGYSLASPDSLVIWEAQFGDFANGAQTIVDQYLSAAESKWRRMSGLVLLLPHGYEGQGPEHSSARLERYLQSCAEFNMTVANISTPANFFHVLRRQLARPFRKPLVVMSPKSLLRHPACVSDISEIQGKTNFQEVIVDPVKDAKKVKRVVFCTGKVYYDLKAYHTEHKRDDVALVRLEQLYPLPKKQIDAIINKYKNAELYFVQEEPSNMGAWQYFLSYYRYKEMTLVARKSSASPATGFKKVHEKQQADIVRRAFE